MFVEENRSAPNTMPDASAKTKFWSNVKEAWFLK